VYADVFVENCPAVNAYQLTQQKCWWRSAMGLCYQVNVDLPADLAFPNTSWCCDCSCVS